MFCAATEEATRRFQQARGLHANAICDEHTWTALVEASWKPGDRQLLLTSPNLRGDDVADLQTRLARLGFDCGRVDGIFGPRVSRALADFQSNCGVPPDGVCGPETLRIIVRVSGQSGTGPGVGAVRERENLRAGFESMANCRVAVGQFGGLSGLTRTLARELRQRGATVMPLDEPDAVAQALAANQFGADVYVGFQGHIEATAVAHYYQVPSFESAGGRALAELIAREMHNVVPDLAPAVSGMRLPVLRETRMPAVLVTIGPVRAATDATPQLAHSVLSALDIWILCTE